VQVHSRKSRLDAISIKNSQQAIKSVATQASFVLFVSHTHTHTDIEHVQRIACNATLTMRSNASNTRTRTIVVVRNSRTGSGILTAATMRLLQNTHTHRQTSNTCNASHATLRSRCVQMHRTHVHVRSSSSSFSLQQQCDSFRTHTHSINSQPVCQSTCTTPHDTGLSLCVCVCLSVCRHENTHTTHTPPLSAMRHPLTSILRAPSPLSF
jgi:hypothetical protein